MFSVYPNSTKDMQTCWRGQLVQKLNQQGLSGKFHFVGTQRSSCSGIGNNGGHEGYPAFKATASPRGPKGKIGGIGGEWDDKKQNLLPKVLAKTHPDVVMILLGINDLVFQTSDCKVRVANYSGRLSADNLRKSLLHSQDLLIKCEQVSRE